MIRETPASQAFKIARDREILDTVCRALAADPALQLFGDNPLLESCREITVGQFIDAARYAGGSARHRHLQPLPATTEGVEMRASLSDRELGVVRLIVEGLSNKEISSRLALSDKTVKNHISHILSKLKLRARTQVAVMALRGGIF
jgi:two-component system, NarL family, response regulator DevR